MSGPATLDPILALRRELGPLRVHTIEAASMADAHRALGALVKRPARAAIAARLAATKPAALLSQLRCARASGAFVADRAARRSTPAEVRGALGEYLASLAAWGEAVGLGALAAAQAKVDGARLSTEDLALWAQDDNTGCQTGMLRRKDGAVILWHTEEDTIGYFDRPRVVSFAAQGEVLSAFLYPYLLPGPAFGFSADQVHAIDSLHVRRAGTLAGSFTSIASWLVWRLGRRVPAREVFRALSPFVDGCAINVVQPSSARVAAVTYEIGARRVQARRLRAAPSAFGFQVNIVSDRESPLGREEALRPRDRALYERRSQRAHEARSRLAAERADPAPEDILRMMANRRGGGYAYANKDVKAHCVACVSTSGIKVYVQSGSAHASDVYRPQWELP